MEDERKKELQSLGNVVMGILLDLRASDAEKCIDFLIDKPEGVKYFFCFENDKISVIQAECDKCKKIFFFPEEKMACYFSNEECGFFLCCQECLENLKEKIVEFETVYNLYHKYFINYHDRVGEKFEDLRF